MDVASKLHDIELNEEMIGADIVNLQGVMTDEEMLVAMLYVNRSWGGSGVGACLGRRVNERLEIKLTQHLAKHVLRVLKEDGAHLKPSRMILVLALCRDSSCKGSCGT